MPVMDIKKDPEALTMEVTCRFAASAERVWQLWADPRQLERWWGPPGYPATVTEHELAAGSKVAYYMTGPEGQKYPGWWTVIAVEPPHRLELQDGFSDADGEPDDSMPTTSMTVTVGDAGDETEMRILSRFPSVEDMNQLLEMGMDQGIQQALSQIDAILAEAPTIG